MIVDSVVEMLQHLSWRIPDDFLLESHFNREMAYVNMNSSPGYPYCLHHTSNGQLLKAHEGNLDPERVHYIYDITRRKIDGDIEVDPIRLFIKPEAISQAKFDKGAYRLISSISLPDRMIDSMLHSVFNKRVVATWPISPIRIGWSPLCGGWKLMNRVPQHAADRSAWDWTVRAWMLELALEVRVRLCENMNPVWLELAQRRYRQLYGNALFVTSGGTYLRQKESGAQKSGNFNTGTDNSIIQLLLHHLVCLELDLAPGVLIACGDDTLQTPQPRHYYERLAKYCILKPVEEKTEFCGFDFPGNGVVNPSHFTKHMFNIMHMEEKVAAQTAQSYSINYFRSDRKEFVDGLFRFNSLPGLNPTHISHIWDGDWIVDNSDLSWMF